MKRNVNAPIRRLFIALMVCLFACHAKAYGDTFEYDGLTVTTDGVEGTDYQKEDRAIRILTDKDFTFSATSTLVKIVVNEGVQNAHFTLSGYNCDRGYGWIGGPIIIGKNSSVTMTLAEGTTNSIRGSWETETMVIYDGASVTIDGTGSLTATTSREQSAGHGAAIQLNKTATLTIKSGTITAISNECTDGEGAAIGCNQFTQETACGTLIIDGGEVNLISYGNAAAFGGGSNCTYTHDTNGSAGGTLIVNGGKLTAQGRIGGGTTYKNSGNGGAGGSITINGGEVSSTMDLGSAANATSFGSIKLVGGTLTTPSVTMADSKVTFTQTTTLTDNFTTSLPVTVAENAVVSINGDASLNIKKKNLTLSDGASISYLNVPTLNDDQYYEINTIGQMRWFAGLIRGTLSDGTEQNLSANGKLMTDLDLNNEPWLPMADYSPWNDGPNQNYFGTFDGNYHTISNLNVQEGYSRGFFGRSCGTIKNLGVINAEVKPGEGWVGVIAADVVHGTIINCWTAGDIVLADGGEKCAGVAGVANIDEWSSAKNCHTSYSAVAETISSNRGSVESSTANIPSDAYKTGELVYLLNTNKTTDETCSWGQIIGTDNHPVALIEGTNNVYQYGKVQDATDLTLGTTAETNRMTTLCFPKDVTLPEKVTAFTVTGTSDTNATLSKLDANVVPAKTPVLLLNTGTAEVTVSLPAASGFYSNDATASTIISQEGNLLKGTYNELSESTTARYSMQDGTFSLGTSATIPAYQCYMDEAAPASYALAIAEYLDYPTKNNDGYYEIYNVAQLEWFRDLVNGTLANTTQDQSANGKLMADIDLDYNYWTPIGDCIAENDNQAYQGIFDGNNHAISKLHAFAIGSYSGFIGIAKNNVIKNLGIIDATIFGGEGGGELWGGVIAGAAYNATILNCWTSDDIRIIPIILDEETLVSIHDAGIANTESCTVKNCHTSYYNVINEITSGSTTLTNCTGNIDSDAHKTGELAFLLNSKKEDSETGWGQKIGKDEHPVALTETNQVYQHGTPQDATTLELKVDETYNRTTTLCYPNEVSLPANVEAFTVTELTTSSSSYMGTAVMSLLDSKVVPANTPVILMNTGLETAKVTLPAISYSYTNNASESTIVSQDGNLLKGTYSKLILNSSSLLDSNTQYGFEHGWFYDGGTIAAYQCFIEDKNQAYFLGLATDKVIGDLEYAVLSEDEKTCYVSKLFYAGIGKNNYELTIPSTTQINGTDYKVVQYGQGTDDKSDKLHFVNLCSSPDYTLYVNLPKTVKTISRQAIQNSDLSMMYPESRTLLRCSTEYAPNFIGAIDMKSYKYAVVDVPYASESTYKAAWGDDFFSVSSRKTEVDIANGYIEVKGNTYTQYTSYTAADEVEYKAIDGTLVIKGTTDKYDIHLEGASEGEPLRIAINGLSIDNQDALGIPSMYVASDLSLIVQGENTLKNAEDIPNIELVDGVSFAINSLSTGTLNLVNGISGDNVAVSAKVYDGSADFTTLDVTKNTALDADRNQLAFTSYDFVTGPDNLVAKGKCQKFVLNDGVDVYAPSAFTANEVTYKRSFNDNGFNALYLPFSVNVDDFDDCEFYVINMFHQSDTDDDGILDNISLEVERIPDGSTLNANHPYLFKYTGTDLDSDHEFNLADVNVLPTESTAYKCSSMSYDYVFTGNYNSLEASDEYYTIGVDSETGKTALVHPSGDDTPAMRWVLRMTPREAQYGTAAQSNVRTISIFDGNEQTTGIGAANADSDRTNAAYYGIDGVRLAKPAKGITLIQQNGRVTKVFTK